MSRFWLTAILAVGVQSAISARADLVAYTGNAFTTTGSGPGHVTGLFDFNVALTDGAVLNETHLNSWSLSAAGRTLTSDAASFLAAEFTIGPSLLPSSWEAIIEQNVEGNPEPESIATDFHPDEEIAHAVPVDYFILNDDETDSFAVVPTTHGASFVLENPGTWAAVPEPSAFACVGLVGVAVAGWNRWKRKSST